MEKRGLKKQETQNNAARKKDSYTYEDIYKQARAVSEEVKMIRADETQGTYYVSIAVDLKIFSDEVDKFRLLQIIRESEEERKYSLLAFNVLDDEVEMVLQLQELAEIAEEGKDDMVQQRLTGIVHNLCNDFLTYYRERWDRAGEQVRERVSWENIGDTVSMVKYCTDIHMRPLKEGYAEHLADYWWSSYQTYRGNYNWHVMDIQPVDLCFSVNLAKGNDAFLRLQRNAQKMISKDFLKN